MGFVVLFCGTTVPINRQQKVRNSTNVEVTVESHLNTPIKAITKGSLSLMVQWFINPLYAHCKVMMVEIWLNPAGATTQS